MVVLRIQYIVIFALRSIGGSVPYVTLRTQKDGRVNLGTAVHRTWTCVALKKSEYSVREILGDIVDDLPRCKKCWKLGAFESERRLGFDVP